MQPSKTPIDPQIVENWPKLKRFFRTKVPEPDCYDLVQETLEAYVRKSQEPGVVIEKPRAYLWGIARNKVLKYISGKRLPNEAFDSAEHSVLGRQTSLSTRFDRNDKLLTALRSLPTDCQIAFELHYGEGLTNEEVALAMGVGLATAKRKIKRAREQLREQLMATSVEVVKDLYRAG